MHKQKTNSSNFAIVRKWLDVTHEKYMLWLIFVYSFFVIYCIFCIK